MIENLQVETAEWFAIKTRQELKAEEVLAPFCEEIFFPKEAVMGAFKKKRIRAVIPRVLFIKTTHSNALKLEMEGKDTTSGVIPFWIYRYPKSNEIQVISQRSIDFLRLLTFDNNLRCRIYTAKDFKVNQRVRVIGGVFRGYEGFIKRIEKNRHVVVNIEGICMVVLPFIHPDLLERIDNSDDEN